MPNSTADLARGMGIDQLNDGIDRYHGIGFDTRMALRIALRPCRRPHMVEARPQFDLPRHLGSRARPKRCPLTEFRPTPPSAREMKLAIQANQD
jgi:hypothetical protein